MPIDPQPRHDQRGKDRRANSPGDGGWPYDEPPMSGVEARIRFGSDASR
jgi:hypothetical protein